MSFSPCSRGKSFVNGPIFTCEITRFSIVRGYGGLGGAVVFSDFPFTPWGFPHFLCNVYPMVTGMMTWGYIP